MKKSRGETLVHETLILRDFFLSQINICKNCLLLNVSRLYYPLTVLIFEIGGKLSGIIQSGMVNLEFMLMTHICFITLINLEV